MRPIRLFLLLVALISLTASPYTVLMPIFARDVFGGDAHTLGFLVGSAGLGAVIVTAASVNMMLQTIVDEDKRGRIISFYAMAFLGMAPVGGLIAGSLAGQLGAPATAMIDGACCLLGTLALMRGLPAIRADLRRALARLTEKA